MFIVRRRAEGGADGPGAGDALLIDARALPFLAEGGALIAISRQLMNEGLMDLLVPAHPRSLLLPLDLLLP